MENPKTERYGVIIPLAELDTKEKRLLPFSVYNQLRQTSSVRYDERRGCWDVFRYEDVHRILKDPTSFSSNRQLNDSKRETILTMDPPRHTQMRGLVSKAFTPKVISDLEPRIASIVTDLLDHVTDSGKMDMVQDLAVPLPVIVIAELLGVPPEDRKLFKAWSDTLVLGTNENTDEAIQKVMQEKYRAVEELDAYFTKIIEMRSKESKEDLISLLLAAEIEGEKLNHKEILGFCTLLLVAGNETTTNLITNAVRYLTEDLNTQQQLRENPQLIPSFIEEVLRFYPPIQATARVAVADYEISGMRIPAGAQVVTWLASANRDEEKFENPDTFMIDRAPNAHLSFGFGVHFCLGAPLARMEAQIALRIIMERMKDIHFVSDEPLTYIQSPFVFGVEHFPITFRTMVKAPVG